MELKGIITEGESKFITCCDSVQDINIGGLSLYDELEKMFNQDSEEYWEDSDKESPMYGVKYIIMDEAPAEDKSFNDLAAEVQQNMMYAKHQNGCYSEYTCGYGGFDYVLGENGEGHSIFEELKGSVGKYIYFQI